MKQKKVYKKISIIIPVLNGWEHTKECLKSIQSTSYPQDKLEVIIIDNNSSDRTSHKIKKLFPHVIVKRFSENVGYTKALNFGARKSKGDYLIFGNNDVAYDKNFFKEMVHLAESDDRIGIIGGKPYFTEQPTKIAFGGLRVNPYRAYNIYDLTNIDKVRPLEINPAGGFFARKSMLKTVGLFDEGFFIYFEDVDLILRAKRKGFKALYNPRAVYYHGFSKTTTRKENLQLFIYHGYRSRIRLMIKNSTLLQMISSLVYLSITIHLNPWRAKAYKPFLKAFYWNMQHFKETLALRGL